MNPMQELQQIRGIGKVLAQRLIDAGNDSCAKVAALGEEGLKQFKGLKRVNKALHRVNA